MTNGIGADRAITWKASIYSLNDNKEFWIAVVVIVATIAGLLSDNQALKDSILEIKEQIALVIITLLGKVAVQAAIKTYRNL